MGCIVTGYTSGPMGATEVPRDEFKYFTAANMRPYGEELTVLKSLHNSSKPETQ